MRRGGDAEFLLSPQNRGKRLKFSKNVLGKNERKVAAVGETARERERERDDSVIVAFIKAVRLTTGIYSKVTHHRIHFCLNFR